MKTIKAMLLGGILFLIPFAVALLLFGKLFGFSLRLANPIADRIPIEAVAGVALAEIVAVLLILVACLVAGLAALSTLGQRLHKKLDEWLLNLIPRYAFIKSMAGSLGSSNETVLEAVLVRFDDLAQIAFEVERGPGELVTVYLPGSPDPWSGSVAHVTADRVKSLGGDFASAVKCLRNVGRGATTLIEESSP
jgi:uncharacterized membrane protein